VVSVSADTLKRRRAGLAGALLATAACAALAAPATVDLVLRGGTVVDGGGGEPYVGDLAIDGDSIVAVGDVGELRGRREIDVTGQAVAPGFINMLSWATVSLLEDPRALSDVRQGVTLEVFGEGLSMGPLTEAMKAETLERQSDIHFAIEWTTLGEYLDYLERRGVAPNVASFVGATTVRIHEVGYENRPPTPAELARMQDLVRQAMAEGALGVGSSLIYAPASFASTDELVALVAAAAESGGMYVSHIRNEGEHLLEAIDELVEIAERTGARAEIYHFKASRPENWHLLEPAIARVEAARARGLSIAANMYTYPASATGLDAAMPTWVQEGGHDKWVERLRDPEIRARVRAEMHLLPPDKMLFIGFRNPALARYMGKTLAEVAADRGTSPEDTVMDLVVEDDSRVGTIYFSMSEDNVRREVALPWMSFGSDAGAPAAEGVFLQSSTHPRSYGTFARVLGRYVRDEGLVSLAEAVRRLSAWPAERLGLERRGRLAPGYFADVAVFDPATVGDRATFEQPHQYSVGFSQVLVNGVAVLADGEPTGAAPGRFLHGPGYREPDPPAHEGGP
jgi:N-acyl-D-aspartate/D-glutamate deacylase